MLRRDSADVKWWLQNSPMRISDRLSLYSIVPFGQTDRQYGSKLHLCAELVENRLKDSSV